MLYLQDVFYDIRKMSVEEKKELLTDAYENSYYYHIDKLDCNISFARQQIKDAKFEDYIDLLDQRAHTVFIKRGGYYEGDEEPKTSSGWRNEHCIEVGFSTMNVGVDFYMFIYVNLDKLNYFIEKYGLKRLT